MSGISLLSFEKRNKTHPHKPNNIDKEEKAGAITMAKGMNVALWIVQILIAGLFLMMGAGKLMSDPEVVANFTRWGMPDKIYLVIGAFEVLGAIGLLIPRLAGLAAVGLILIMTGALFTHLTHGEMGMAMLPLVVMILLGAIAYLRNPLKVFVKTPEQTQ